MMRTYPRVNDLAPGATLNDEESNGSDDGDKVEGQIHEVSNKGFEAEAFKRSLDDPSEPFHGS